MNPLTAKDEIGYFLAKIKIIEAGEYSDEYHAWDSLIYDTGDDILMKYNSPTI